MVSEPWCVACYSLSNCSDRCLCPSSAALPSDIETLYLRFHYPVSSEHLNVALNSAAYPHYLRSVTLNAWRNAALKQWLLLTWLWEDFESTWSKARAVGRLIGAFWLKAQRTCQPVPTLCIFHRKLVPADLDEGKGTRSKSYLGRYCQSTSGRACPRAYRLIKVKGTGWNTSYAR